MIFLGQILFFFYQKIVKFLEIVTSTNFTSFLEKIANFLISLNWKKKKKPDHEYAYIIIFKYLQMWENDINSFLTNFTLPSSNVKARGNISNRLESKMIPRWGTSGVHGYHDLDVKPNTCEKATWVMAKKIESKGYQISRYYIIWNQTYFKTFHKPDLKSFNY